MTRRVFQPSRPGVPVIGQPLEQAPQVMQALKSNLARNCATGAGMGLGTSTVSAAGIALLSMKPPYPRVGVACGYHPLDWFTSESTPK